MRFSLLLIRGTWFSASTTSKSTSFRDRISPAEIKMLSKCDLAFSRRDISEYSRKYDPLISCSLMKKDSDCS